MKLLLVIILIGCTNASLLESVGGSVGDLTKDVTTGVKNVQKATVTDVKKTISTVDDFVDDTASDVINGVDATVKKLSTDVDTEGKQKSVIPAQQLIEKEGYPMENYYLTTSDGYILNILRIPHGKTGKSNGKVVYLQHGLLATCTDWILLGPTQSLAYILADEGYDIWLGNCRGNTYSRNHTTLNPDEDAEFWQFSWHEIGMIDIPETIDFILKKSKKEKLLHIGHSQGTTTFYVMASKKTDYNKKVQCHISLAPIAFMDHMTSPLIRLLSLGNLPLGLTLESLGMNEFLPDEGFFNSVEYICKGTVGKGLCKNALFAITGFNPKQLKDDTIPLLMDYYPGGASTRQVVHYAQEVISGRFCQYDFGPLDNFKKYQKLTPPDYDLSKIKAPVYLMYGANDWLAAVQDVKRLSKKLGNQKEMYQIPDPNWNHIDFVYGIDAPRLVYSRIISTLANC